MVFPWERFRCVVARCNFWNESWCNCYVVAGVKAGIASLGVVVARRSVSEGIETYRETKKAIEKECAEETNLDYFHPLSNILFLRTDAADELCNKCVHLNIRICAFTQPEIGFSDGVNEIRFHFPVNRGG